MICKFCQTDLSSHQQSLLYICKTCNVEYSVNGTHLFGLTYYLSDPTYSVWVMHLDTEISIVYLNDNSRFTIFSIYPDTHPKDAVKLISRIHNLMVFA